MLKLIPNIVTLLNLACGTVSVFIAASASADIFTFEFEFAVAAWLIVIAAVLDFFDGFLARTFNAVSELGKQLDSLSDLVSFGVAPAVILFGIIKYSFTIIDLNLTEEKLWVVFVLFSPVVMVMFSALRLAKFNIDEKQKKSFRGVPTPANALLIASLPLILYYNPPLLALGAIVNMYTVLTIVVVQSALMVIPFRTLSFKFSNLGIKNNLLKYVLILVSILIIVLYGFCGIPFVYISYIVLSLLQYIPFLKPAE